MATTVLYRISSNEVIKISPLGQTFADRDTTFWGVLTNPSFPDGNVLRDTLPNGDRGPLRQIGFAKIAEPGTNNVRNATQGEINGFDALEIDDENKQDASGAITFLQDHPRFRKLFVALVDVMKDEINSVRANFNPPLTARTLSQFKNAIRNRVSKND